MSQTVSRIGAALVLGAWALTAASTALTGYPATPATTALAGVVLAGLLAVLAAHAFAPARLTSRAAARARILRHRAHGTIYLPSRDPAAPGRPRPRAPSAPYATHA